MFGFLFSKEKKPLFRILAKHVVTYFAAYYTISKKLVFICFINGFAVIGVMEHG